RNRATHLMMQGPTQQDGGAHMEVVRYGRTYRVSHSCGRGRPEFAFRRRLRRAFQHLLQLAGLAALGAVLMLLTGCAAQSSAAPRPSAWSASTRISAFRMTRWAWSATSPSRIR